MCGDKAGGIMTYDFKSNKYEIKPSNSILDLSILMFQGM